MEDEKIKKLVQNKKEINNLYHTFHDGTNILHWAAFYNNTELLEKGIKKCDINKIGGIYKSTPIFFAVYNENFKSILILIKNKANLQVVNKIGYNLLHLSEKYDYILCYLLFKCYKVPENQKDFNLNLPVDIAIRNSSKKILSHKTNKKRPEGNFLNYITAFFFCYSIIFFNWLVLNVFIFLISRELISKWFNAFIRKILVVFIFFSLFCRNVYAVIYFQTTYNYFVHLSIKRPKNRRCLRRRVITKLILKDKYNLENYCYICLHVKRMRTHCGTCNKCVSTNSYHCFFIDRCIKYNEILKIILCIINFYVALISLLRECNVNNLNYFIIYFITFFTFSFFTIIRRKFLRFK